MRPVGSPQCSGKWAEGTRPGHLPGRGQGPQTEEVPWPICHRGCVGWRGRNPVTCRNALENGRRERAPAIFRGADKTRNTGIALVNLPSRMRRVAQEKSRRSPQCSGKWAERTRPGNLPRCGQELQHRNCLGEFAVEDARGSSDEFCRSPQCSGTAGAE